MVIDEMYRLVTDPLRVDSPREDALYELDKRRNYAGLLAQELGISPDVVLSILEHWYEARLPVLQARSGFQRFMPED